MPNNDDKHFLALVFQSEDGLLKSTRDYIVEAATSNTENILTSDLCQYVKKEVSIQCITEKFYLLCLLHEKVQESVSKVLEISLEQLSLNISLHKNPCKELSYLREIELIFIYCLEQLLDDLHKIDENLRSIKNDLEAFTKTNSELIARVHVRSEDAKKLDLEKELNEKFIEVNETKRAILSVLSMSSIEILTSERERLFILIIKGVYEKKMLDLTKLYLAVNCGSRNMLVSFQNVEITFLKSLNMFDSILNDEPFYKNFNCRSLFIFSVANKKSLALTFYELLTSLFRNNMLCDFPQNLIWCVPLYLFIFVHQWSLSKDKLSMLPLLKKLLAKYGNESDALIHLHCSQKVKHMELTLWCRKYKSSLNVNKLLTLLQSHTSLYAIQACMPLFYLPYQRFLEILMMDGEIGNSAGYLNKVTSTIYQSYSILLWAFHIILAGIEMDKVVTNWREQKIQRQGFLSNYGNDIYGNFEIKDDDLNSCKLYYKSYIVKKWFYIRKVLSKINPPEYRLEVLENLFSLFFIKHTNLSDESNQDSYIEESEPASMSPKLEKQGISNSSLVSSSNLSHHVTSLKMMKSIIKGSSRQDKVITFNETSADSRDDVSLNLNVSDEGSNNGDQETLCVKTSKFFPCDSFPPNGNEFSSVLSLKLLKSTNSELSSSSSVGDFPWCGYIINTLVAWDLLLVLEESLGDLGTYIDSTQNSNLEEFASYVSVNHQQFLERYKSLYERVQDGLWRLKVALPKSREIGSDEVVGDFMKGTLYSNVSSIVHYEVETQSEESKQSRENKSQPSLSMAYNILKDNESITNFLLSSPKDLINIALVNQNLVAGHLLFSKHNLQNSKEKQELILMKCLKENIPKIEEISKMKTKDLTKKVSIANSSTSTAIKIENEIQQNSHNVVISTLIDQVLNLSVMETHAIEKEESASAPWIKICPKFLLLDIALTSSISEENASKLFTASFGQELHLSGCSINNPSLPIVQEYLGKLPELHCLSQVMERIKLESKKSILKEGTCTLFKSLLPQTSNPASLLLAKCPLNLEDFESYQCSWMKLLSCISNFVQEWLRYELNRGNDFDMDFESFFNNITIAIRDSKSSKSCSYFKYLESNEHLSNFLSYMNLLKNIASKYSTGTSSFIGNEGFEVLEESPIHIFGKLIFSQKVDPYQLEVDSHYMELDMLPVIIKFLISPYEILQVKESEKSSCSLASVGCVFFNGTYVMNANNLQCSKPTHGDLVVSDLLASLLDLLHDIDDVNSNDQFSIVNISSQDYLKHPQIRNALLESSEICSADLTKLCGDYEKLVFYINLANLMFLHATLLNSLISDIGLCCDFGIFSSSKMEQIVSFKRVGYLVGQLGFVSLYDIIFKILRQPLQYGKYLTPDSTIISLIEYSSDANEFSFMNLISFSPLAIFIVSQGLNPSPKINVFFPDSFEEQMKAAVSDYFLQIILPNLNGNFRSLEINPILFTFLSTHPSGWNDAVKILKNFFEDTDEHLLSFYFDWLRKVKYKKINPIVNFTLEKVIIKYNGICDVTPSYRKINAEKSSSMLDLPPLTAFCSSYINDHCPIINSLLRALNMTKEKESFDRTTTLWKHEQDTSILDNFFSYSKMYHSVTHCITNNFEKAKVFSKVHYNYYYIPVIEAIEEILNSILLEDFLKKNITALKSILKIVDILSSVPSIVCEHHFLLSHIWDAALVYLSSAEPSRVFPSPWMNVFKIRRLDVRFKAMQDNFINWPIETVLKCLNYMDFEEEITPSQKAFVKDKIDQMTIYSEIMILSKEHLRLETCQDVLRVSQQVPEDLLNHLIHQRQFTLALRWVKSHGLTERFYLQALNASLLQYLDVPEPDFQKAESILYSVSSEKLGSVIIDLLDKMKVHYTRKFLLSFFIKRNFQEVSNACVFAIKQELMGLILVEDVAPKFSNWPQLLPLAPHPLLIIEQWIMNLKLEAVEKASLVLSPILDSVECALDENNQNDVCNSSPNIECLCWNHYYKLIEKYAFKALEISVIQTSLKHSLKEDSQDSQFIVPLQVPLKSDWEKNSTVSSCPVCKTAIFSFFCRRHHCRRCGRVVCSACSSNRHRVQGYDDVPVRVCQNCYVNLSSKCNILDQSILSTTDLSSTKGSSCLDVGWYFSHDHYHNQCVRDEFSFDYAPSLSLCHAILSLHKDGNRAALCILKICHKLYETAIDSFADDFSEVDSSFVLRMIQTLVSSAKIRFGILWNHGGISLCEYYTQWVGFLQLLLNSRCISLLPPGTMNNMLQTGKLRRLLLSGTPINSCHIEQNLEQERRFLRILRNNLVKNEMWDLALDISTKAGFETSGVWGAQAMASLKVGDFALAREHFSKVLTKPIDKSMAVKSAVLEEIIFYLESSSFNLDPSNPDASFSSTVSARFNPLIISQSLKNLSNFTLEHTRLNSCNLDIFLPSSDFKFSLSPLQRRECEYYLRLYGSHSSFLQFLIRHNRIRDAVKYTKEVDVDVKTFTNEVLLPSFRKGRFNRVWIGILEVDPKQVWSPSMVCRICKYLEHNNYLHCLLEVQKALSDRLRTAMTYLRLYTRSADSYSELVHRTQYLKEASAQLQAYLNVIPLNEGSVRRKVHRFSSLKRLSHICLQSTSWNVNRQINMSIFQEDVAKYLADLESSGNDFKPLIEIVKRIIYMSKQLLIPPSSEEGSGRFQVPTVFTRKDRLIVCVLLVSLEKNLSKNLGLVYRLVETNSVHPKDLLSVTLQTLLATQKTENVHKVFEGILEWGLIPTSQVKAAIWPAFILGAETIPEKVVREISKFLPNQRDKMELFMEAGLLKLAYSHVNEKGSREDVELLKRVAVEKHDRTVELLCTKWLQYKKFAK